MVVLNIGNHLTREERKQEQIQMTNTALIAQITTPSSHWAACQYLSFPYVFVKLQGATAPQGNGLEMPPNCPTALCIISKHQNDFNFKMYLYLERQQSLLKKRSFSSF
jgi:hypothetical protein